MVSNHSSVKPVFKYREGASVIFILTVFVDAPQPANYRKFNSEKETIIQLFVIHDGGQIILVPIINV